MVIHFDEGRLILNSKEFALVEKDISSTKITTNILKLLELIETLI
jgi:hypothetical protein